MLINSMKLVTKEFECLVVELYMQGLGTMKIAEQLNSTKNIVHKVLVKNNIVLRKQSSNKYTVNKNIELEVVKLYNSGMGTMGIVNKVNIPRWYIQRILQRNGINLRKRTPNMNYDVAFFKTYTPESCYWAGFIAADGFLKKNRALVSVKLSIRDSKHLKNLAVLTKHTVGVTEKDDICELIFTGPWYYEDLINNFDIKPLKTPNIYISNKIPSYLLSHYIRGYFDGDGCITYTTCPTISFTSDSIVLLNQLIELFFNLGVRLKTKLKKPMIQNNKAITYSGKNAKKILDWMYQNSYDTIRLERKYARYLKYFYN